MVALLVVYVYKCRVCEFTDENTHPALLMWHDSCKAGRTRMDVIQSRYA